VCLVLHQQLMRVAVVVGVGPGIGNSVAIKFASKGYKVALISRRQQSITPVQEAIEKNGGHALSVTADACSEESMATAFSTIRKTLGTPDVLIYNAATRRLKKQGITEVSTEEFIQFWKINCLGAFFASREVVPGMLARGQGTIIFTGATASVRSLDGLSSFTVGKFGLRALAQSMARELAPKGIHVAHTIIDGAVGNSLVHQILTSRNEEMPKDLWMNPDEIAEQYWNLHTQHKSVWTHELDLRPFAETMFSKL